jgi:hypothetical protein
MKTTSSKMALKPYLEAVKGHCERLSKEELTATILELAQDMPMGARGEFLDKIRAFTPHTSSAKREGAEHLEEALLERIEALREEIEERIAAIENGDYFEDREPWEDDYDEEDPDYVTEEQADQLDSLFHETGALFLDGQLESARRLYQALFDLIDDNEDVSRYFSSSSSTSREARARFCRCVYDTADPVNRLDDFFACMTVNVDLSRYRLDLESEPFPMVQDVIDARADELDDWESFLPAWEQKVASSESSRAAVLRMEAVAWLEGLEGISRLAREWQSRQPYGYLFWIQRLEMNEDWRKMLGACQEALEALPLNSFREQAAEYLVTAAVNLGEARLVLQGKRERFLSAPNEKNLLDLLEEAESQNLRSQELDAVLAHKAAITGLGDSQGGLFIKMLLMAGRLDEAFTEGQNEKAVGWSFGKGGILYAGVLSALTENSPQAKTVDALLREYADRAYTIFGGTAEKKQELHSQIVKGLASLDLSQAERQKYLAWANKTGRDRVESIVTGQHRKAYDRAARTLGALAECYVVSNERDKAKALLHEFTQVKFPRHRAFRDEVKRVVGNSPLLRELRVI